VSNAKKILNDVVRIVLAEAEQNSDFASRLNAALGINSGENKDGPGQPRARNRRPRAVLDPVAIARSGEAELRSSLSRLNIEQLKDVVADYGMDTGKLVTKWKSADRIIDRIVEIAILRAQKGDAFRSDSE